ncbi:endonuclease domain-containing protein [Sphingomonas sp. So64.6b]|uniref:endonuclease domain-containing protein n=1 Tax=Sphingomonas sp. So64.6b TaxID=2997354 RepID=UPI001FCE6630|nr:endonuclease domain-containing protein [Sphingomonas sp. So64.6b]
MLRKQPDGAKFRRQHPAGPYSLDFYCDAAKLAIEVDGETHNRGDRPERDEVRDAWLTMRGVRTLRINAVDILRDLDAVVRYIIATVNARGGPLHHPSDGPPPPAGEEF